MSKRNYRQPNQSRNTKSKSNISIGNNSGVSIIIPVLNVFDLLERCLKAIPAAFGDIPYEVILVDNGSKEEEANPFYERMKDGYSHVYKMKKNTGFPYACNFGASKAKYPLFFFLNSDVELFPDSIHFLVDDMKVEKTGIVGMKLMFPPDIYNDPIRPAGKIQHVGLFSDLQGQITHLFVGWSPENPRPNAVRDVLAVTGAALMTKAYIFKKLGGFDLIYGQGTFEDCDLAMKMHKLDFDVLVNIQACGYHYVGASSKANQVGFNLQQNVSIFNARWAGTYGWSEWLAW